jgi:PAS domain S-box-containing protein
MSWRVGVYVQLHVLAALVVVTLGAYAVRNRQTPGTRSLAILLFAMSGWAAGYAFVLAAPTQAVQTKLLLSRLTFVPIVFVPLLWFTFVLEYTGSGQRTVRRVLPLLALVSMGFALAGLTNPSHGLVWQSFETTPGEAFTFHVDQYGPLYGIYLAYSYALLAGGAALVVRMFLGSNRFHRGQALALLTAMAIPVVGNVLYFAGLTEPGFDPTAMSVSLSGVALWSSVYRHRLLTLAPATTDVTRDEFVDRMTTPVLALNDRTEVVEANAAALALFGHARAAVVGRRLVGVAPELAGLVDRHVPDVTGQQVYRRHVDGVHRTYDVGVEPLSWEGDGTAGRLVSLHDVTERRRREEHLRVLHRLLRHNLRNDLNVVMGHASDLGDSAESAAVANRATVIERTATRLAAQADKLGRVIHEVDTEVTQTVDIAELLEDVVSDARARHRANIALHVDQSAAVVTGPILRLAFAELVENAVVHSGTRVPNVDVRVGPVEGDPSVIGVSVADDGPGIPDHEVEALRLGEEKPLEHTTGVGLWVVSWAVRRHGGRFSFDVDETGTTVVVLLPRASDD